MNEAVNELPVRNDRGDFVYGWIIKNEEPAIGSFSMVGDEVPSRSNVFASLDREREVKFSLRD